MLWKVCGWSDVVLQGAIYKTKKDLQSTPATMPPPLLCQFWSVPTNSHTNMNKNPATMPPDKQGWEWFHFSGPMPLLYYNFINKAIWGIKG